LNLRLERQWLTKVCTIGHLYIDNKFFCYTLEDTVRPFPNKIPKQTAIWEGLYPVTIDFSQKFQKDMPHVLDVPMFEGIRIHSGNTAVDTEGCILLGYTHDAEAVYESRRAFNDFFPKLKAALDNGQSCWIDIINPIVSLTPTP